MISLIFNDKFLPVCVCVFSSGRPMVVSSGMQSMETMRRVYQIVKKHNENFCILQCTSAYPLEPEHVNLRVITVTSLCSCVHACACVCAHAPCPCEE